MNKKGKFKFFLSVIIILIIPAVSYFGYLIITYIDETVIEGEKYGFMIGDSKIETFKKAEAVFSEEKIFILYPIDNQNFGPHKVISFEKGEYELISKRDDWEFYFNNEYFDLLRLSFSDDKLIQIYRHRKKFELP